MHRTEGLEQIDRTQIIAIVRGVAEKDIFHVAEALYDGGITVMEITLNTPGALSMIRSVQDTCGSKMYIGAGTVLDRKDAERAIDAGAAFLVTPNTDEETIRFAVDSGIPIVPGAMTPTEIVRAYKSGAEAVKIFPSGSFGLPFLKELMGPLDSIPMVAVGGVHEGNIRKYLDIGCRAVGIGGSLVNLAEIAAGNFQWITDKAERLTEAAVGPL